MRIARRRSIRVTLHVCVYVCTSMCVFVRVYVGCARAHICIFSGERVPYLSA